MGNVTHKNGKLVKGYGSLEGAGRIHFPAYPRNPKGRCPPRRGQRSKASRRQFAHLPTSSAKGPIVLQLLFAQVPLALEAPPALPLAIAGTFPG